VIPVLFGLEGMPEPKELPEDIRPLVKLNACFWHLNQAAAAQLQKLSQEVELGRLPPRRRPSRETVDKAKRGGVMQPTLQADEDAGPGSAQAGTRKPAEHKSEAAAQLGGALSAQVIALCAELLNEISDEATRGEVERIQSVLRNPVGGGRHVLGDAARADEALARLESLSWRQPNLRFVRDRIEQLRDTGPDMQMIELAKWYDRCSAGEVELPQREREELERLLMARSLAERLGLAPGASSGELRAAADDRARAWRTFAAGARAGPKAQLLAGVVAQFYEERSQSDEQPGRSVVGARSNDGS
jgi:hypothetical protein